MLFLFIQIALSILRVLGLYVFLIYIFFLVCLRGFCSPRGPRLSLSLNVTVVALLRSFIAQPEFVSSHVLRV